MRVAAATALLLTVVGCGIHTAPFEDQRGRVVPGSIATMTDLTIGGVRQRVWFRGTSLDNPALILLHGGPGASEAALFRRFTPELEQSYLVVYWEQRGSGRSYHGDIPPESMTIARFVSDLDELVEAVRTRFGKDRVVLVGHSWGTAIGLLYAAAHPEKVAAYVGVAQVADMRRGERLSREFALREARRRKHRGAIEELESIGDPPHMVSQMLTSRKWVERFGGSFHADLSTGKLIWAALRTDEANLCDLIRFGRGNRFSLRSLWEEFRTLDLTARHTSFDVPIAFFLGRHDWQVPAVLAAEYFDRIQAPRKRLVWFERSAHNPPFEQPADFARILRDELQQMTAPAGGERGARERRQ